MHCKQVQGHLAALIAKQRRIKIRQIDHAGVCNPRTRDVETGGLESQGYPRIESKSEVSMGCIKPGLKNEKKLNETK